MSFKCQECGRKFKTAKSAERASMDGCPKCGGVDIDLDVTPKPDHDTMTGKPMTEFERRENSLMGAD